MRFLGVLLYPFTVLYDFGTRVRNYLFDIGYKTSFEFDRCIINVGNLSVGGTGKSPMVEYLIRLLNKDFKVTTLSRGYGRKTRGFRLAGEEDTAATLGDEPFQFHRKFSNIAVAIGEERAVAIPYILAEKPETEIILLDDAYQHRFVKPDFNILLTSYDRPFFTDWILPSGRLRESRKGARRADTVVVTKCPEDLSENDRENYKSQIAKYTRAPVYFSKIQYLKPRPVFSSEINWKHNVFLFTGIANSAHLCDYIEHQYNLVGQLHFGDHHDFSEADIDKLLNAFRKYQSEAVIVTTEKDMVRLLSTELERKLKDKPLFYIPIETQFIEDGEKFDTSVLNLVKSQVH